MSGKIIQVYGVYAAVCVADLEASLKWYEKLIGRPADDKPISGMAQWRDIGGAGLQLWQDSERTGKSTFTIVIKNLAEEKARLVPLGIATTDEATGDFGAVAQVFDPDGNRISLAEPPPGFTP